MAKIFSRNDRWYAMLETAFGTAVAAAGGGYFRSTPGATINAVNTPIESESKTGSRSQPAALPGRRKGEFSIPVEIGASGVAATVGEHDELLQALFGQAATSGVYTLSDAIKSLTLYRYRTSGAGSATGVSQKVGLGCVVNKAVFEFGGNILKATFSGTSKYVSDSQLFADYDADQKGGLTSVAAEPTPTLLGGPIPGFLGSITIAGVALVSEFVKGTLTIESGAVVVDNAFGSRYPLSAEGDLRNVTLDLDIFDVTGSDMATIIAAAEANEGVEIEITIGDETGYMLTFDLPKVELIPPKTDDGQRAMTLQFRGAKCKPSTATAKDEVSLTCA